MGTSISILHLDSGMSKYLEAEDPSRNLEENSAAKFWVVCYLFSLYVETMYQYEYWEADCAEESNLRPVLVALSKELKTSTSWKLIHFDMGEINQIMGHRSLIEQYHTFQNPLKGCKIKQRHPWWIWQGLKDRNWRYFISDYSQCHIH